MQRNHSEDPLSWYKSRLIKLGEMTEEARSPIKRSSAPAELQARRGLDTKGWELIPSDTGRPQTSRPQLEPIPHTSGREDMPSYSDIPSQDSPDLDSPQTPQHTSNVHLNQIGKLTYI